MVYQAMIYQTTPPYWSELVKASWWPPYGTKDNRRLEIPNFIRAYSLPWASSGQGFLPCMSTSNPFQLLPSHCGMSGSWLVAEGFGHHAFTHTHPKLPCNSACQLRTDGTVHESPGCWLKHIQYCRSSFNLPLLFRTNSTTEYRQPNEANSTANHGLITINSGSMYRRLIWLLGRCYHCRQMTQK